MRVYILYIYIFALFKMNIEDISNLYTNTVSNFNNLTNEVLGDSEASNKYKCAILSDILNNIKFVANNIYNLKNMHDIGKLDEYLIPCIYLDIEISECLSAIKEEDNTVDMQESITTMLDEFKDISDIAAEYYIVKSSYEKNEYHVLEQLDNNDYYKFIDSVKKITANKVNLKVKYGSNANILNILANIEHYIEDIHIL